VNFVSTHEIVKNETYFTDAKTFFANFPEAFSSSCFQVLKLETRQEYQEHESLSYKAMKKGDWKKSLDLIPSDRQIDIPLYNDLKNRGVDFIRCRPLEFPLTEYMCWELEVLRFNDTIGESVLCCNLAQCKDVFERFANHDFMVFDTKIAFVHHYNEQGLIVGGWKIENLKKILSLQKLFAFIKAECKPIQFF
jgi:hypothetical protein